MSQPGYSKLKPYRIHVLYFFIIWWTPALLGSIFGDQGELIGGLLQLTVFFLAFLFLLGSFLKSKNGYVFSLFFFMAFLGFLRLHAIINKPQQSAKVIDPMGIGIFFFSLLVILLTTYKFSSGFLWYRHLPLFLELAAKPIMETTDGYTNRPYPVGKSQYGKEEVIAFARYLHKNLIATSYIEKDQVVLVFSNGLFQYIPFFKPNFQDLTYVSFHEQGNIVVNFARKDYKKYWDEITFDQLCNSFGNIIIDFFQVFKKWKGDTFYKKWKGDAFLKKMSREGLEIHQPGFIPALVSGFKKIKPWRVILSGLFAFFVLITVAGFLESTLFYPFLKQDIKIWANLATQWGVVENFLSLLLAVLKSIAFMWLYVAFLPRFGASMKNVLITTVTSMGLLILSFLNLNNLGLIVPLVPTAAWIREWVCSVIELPIGIYAGAWLYWED